MPRALIVGGGTLGSALARLCGAAGMTVVVFSRRPRNHPGLWIQAKEALPAVDKVWVALGPGPEESGLPVWGTVLPQILDRLGEVPIHLCGPSGQNEPGMDAFYRATEGRDVLHLPPLFGVDDPWIGAAARQLREGGVPVIERTLPSFWPLWVEDAARAAFAGVTGHLRGPAAFRPEQVMDLLLKRYPGRWRYALRLRASAAALRLRAQQIDQDDWSETHLGSRLRLEEWILRLPAPRA